MIDMITDIFVGVVIGFFAGWYARSLRCHPIVLRITLADVALGELRLRCGAPEVHDVDISTGYISTGHANALNRVDA